MIVGMSQSLLPKNARSKRPLELRLDLGPLPQLVVQNRTYKLRTRMTTQFPFWWTEDFSDQEEQNISYETKDYTQHIFDPEPNLKREFTPHEAIQKFVSRHFTTSLSSHRRDVIQEECGIPIIKDFVVPKVNPQILNSEKVQQNRNIVEGDKRVSEIPDSAFAASWPLISLWNKIVTSDEDIKADEVLDRLQQSLMCIGSAFKGLSVHRHKYFLSCLTKEFLSLTDEKDPASDKLSEYLFGNDLSE